MTDRASEITTEIGLGILGLILSVGMLRANELLDVVSTVELYEANHESRVVTVFVNELVFMALFGLSYVMFLLVALLGTWRIVGQERGKVPTPVRFIGIAILCLGATSFFASALAFSHVFHRYEWLRGAARDYTIKYEDVGTSQRVEVKSDQVR